MKSQLIAVCLLLGTVARAQEPVLKTMVCENAGKKALVKIHSPSGGVLGTVEWHVQNKTSGRTTSASGYLYMEKGLNKFKSLDVFDSLEVHDSVLKLTDLSGEEEGETLHCR